jgi:hypothetical protein
MVCLNDGSISHDPPVKYYEYRHCNVTITKQSDDYYEVSEAKDKEQKLKQA